MILAELGSSVRIIPLDRRQHLGDALRSWHGDSIGRWENDTLVVDTTSVNEKREFRGATSNLHLVERFRRVSADLILYQVTLEDPATWPTPWTVEVPMRPLRELIYEFACPRGTTVWPTFSRALGSSNVSRNEKLLGIFGMATTRAI